MTVGVPGPRGAHGAAQQGHPDGGEQETAGQAEPGVDPLGCQRGRGGQRDPQRQDAGGVGERDRRRDQQCLEGGQAATARREAQPARRRGQVEPLPVEVHDQAGGEPRAARQAPAASFGGRDLLVAVGVDLLARLEGGDLSHVQHVVDPHAVRQQAQPGVLVDGEIPQRMGARRPSPREQEPHDQRGQGGEPRHGAGGTPRRHRPAGSPDGGGAAPRRAASATASPRSRGIESGPIR